MDDGDVVDHIEPRANRQFTLVCHVLSEPAGAGRFVGRVEVVATGEVVSVRDLTDLADLLIRLNQDD